MTLIKADAIDYIYRATNLKKSEAAQYMHP